MSRKTCILRDKIINLCLIPTRERKDKPVERWTINMSIDEAASKLHPVPSDNTKAGTEKFYNRLKRAKEQARKLLLSMGVR